MNKCTVIIVNYNTGELLSQVVSSVIDGHSINQVIVVDNGSHDNSMDLLPQHDRLNKQFRHENFGFADSCNFAAKLSHTDFLLFLNPDCLVDGNSITVLIESLESNLGAAIIGCHVVNPDGTEQRASRRRLPTFWRAFKSYSGLEKLAKYFGIFAGVNLNHEPVETQTHAVEAISGALILMKKEVFLDINGFDDKFPLHFEDLDLFKRTLDKGHTILYDPNVQVTHHQGISSQSNPQVSQLKKKGLLRYFHKHCSYVSFLCIKLFNKIL